MGHVVLCIVTLSVDVIADDWVAELAIIASSDSWKPEMSSQNMMRFCWIIKF